MPDDDNITVTDNTVGAAEDLRDALVAIKDDVDTIVDQGNFLADPGQSNWQGPIRDDWVDDWESTIRDPLVTLQTSLVEFLGDVEAALDAIREAAGLPPG
jgi:hypothetical protein